MNDAIRSSLELHQSLVQLATQARQQVAANPVLSNYLLPDASPTPSPQSGGSSK